MLRTTIDNRCDGAADVSCPVEKASGMPTEMPANPRECRRIRRLRLLRISQSWGIFPARHYRREPRNASREHRGERATSDDAKGACDKDERQMPTSARCWRQRRSQWRARPARASAGLTCRAPSTSVSASTSVRPSSARSRQNSGVAPQPIRQMHGHQHNLEERGHPKRLVAAGVDCVGALSSGSTRDRPARAQRGDSHSDDRRGREDTAPAVERVAH